ncbi:carboxypeptidase Y-deficient [Sporothrix epigloea]|uniref:Carboxypeptidase Y-deficient n=1 Tax=Sporothrix epigloea TaxID=1892477 RepID=A0ABP0DS77_9PEZI
MIEQSVVAWENDSSVAREIGLSVLTRSAASNATPSEKAKAPGDGKVDIDIRICHQRAYETLRQFEYGIRQMMPVFQRLLQALQPDMSGSANPPVLRVQIQEAAKTRKRLMDSFAKYNLAAVRLRDLKTNNETQRRLQNSVYSAASTFLHANMVPLKHVPKMLRAQHTSPGGSSTHNRLPAISAHSSPLRYGGNVGDGADSASVAGSEASTTIALLGAEEKELREKLVVLEEQRFLVQQMVDGAHGSRRFEEVGTLRRNVEELDGEIDRLRQQIRSIEERWDGLYASQAAP